MKNEEIIGVDEKSVFRVSVRDLVAAALPPDNLGTGFTGRTSGVQGIAIHSRIQNSRPMGYKKEVAVSLVIDKDAFRLDIFGRADGLTEDTDPVTVEEIKTCRQSPELWAVNPDPRHLAQLKCYGYMVARNKKLENIALELTYAHTLSLKESGYKRTYSLGELESFFNTLVKSYVALIKDQRTWGKIRDRSIAALDFPYPDFRDGQRSLSESVYRIIRHGKILFARAPTGTGKTMAALFPAVKALGTGETEKIFYLTAKTPGLTVAYKALKDLAEKGGRIKSVILTAKQKICFLPDKPCDMETCPYARAYYTKLNRAMASLAAHDLFDRRIIEKTALAHEICPFELSLDLAVEADIIVCDLNYAFDPRVYLKRFFDRSTRKVTFLIDEAHNLVDRLRSMYSAKLLRSEILEALVLVREEIPELIDSLVAVHKEVIRLKTRLSQNSPGQPRISLDNSKEFLSLTDLPQTYMATLEEFALKADLWLDRNQDGPVRSQLLAFWFEITGFLTIAKGFGSHYRFFIEVRPGREVITSVFCMDPSPIFSKLIKRAHAAVFFSATFYPADYYRNLLFGHSEAATVANPLDHASHSSRSHYPPAQDKKEKPKKSEPIIPYSIVLNSPFPRKNLNLVIHENIQTTYRARKQYYNKLAAVITQTVKSRQGNYLVFFPSYAYMEAIVKILAKENILPGIRVQEPGMDESLRQEFIDQFKAGSTITGFAVMGGIFGEGIDLEGDRLIGVIIVGVGLPQITPAREEIRAYYDSRGEDGFFTAYQMPGFSRVLQATGRLIRTETDRGTVVLVDQRFTGPELQALFPLEWACFQRVTTSLGLKENLARFWERENRT